MSSAPASLVHMPLNLFYDFFLFTVGGSEPFRSYWEMYLPQGWLLIFVVDSADHKRLPEAKKCLHQLIDPNPGLPLVVFANKQVKICTDLALRLSGRTPCLAFRIVPQNYVNSNLHSTISLLTQKCLVLKGRDPTIHLDLLKCTLFQ